MIPVFLILAFYNKQKAAVVLAEVEGQFPCCFLFLFVFCFFYFFLNVLLVHSCTMNLF